MLCYNIFCYIFDNLKTFGNPAAHHCRSHRKAWVKQMSKEIMEKIREAEAKADRILAEAEAKAAQMRAEAEAKGQEKCKKAEAEAAEGLKQAIEAAKAQADALTAETIKTSQAEAEAVSRAASAKVDQAKQIVIGGLEAKCR